MTGMLAETTALHGDVDAARALLDTLEAAAGDDPYAITVWATIAARIAAIVGDPAVGATRGGARHRRRPRVLVRLPRHLPAAGPVLGAGRDRATTLPAAAVEAERIIAANLLDPPRSCVATWYALLGEMLLAAGSTDEASVALDRADFYLDAYGQRYPEGLLLLLRARLLQACGEPVAVVRAAAERARALSTEREAHLFVRRAEEFLTTIDAHPATNQQSIHCS